MIPPRLVPLAASAPPRPSLRLNLFVAFKGQSDAAGDSALISLSLPFPQKRDKRQAEQPGCDEMTSPSPTHSDSSSSSKHDSNQVGVPPLASLRMCFYNCDPHFPPFYRPHVRITLCSASGLFHLFVISRSQIFSFSLFLPPGQLGDRGGPQGGSCQHEGAQRAGGPPAEAEEVAHEGMAQGETQSLQEHLNIFSLLFPRFSGFGKRFSLSAFLPFHLCISHLIIR